MCQSNHTPMHVHAHKHIHMAGTAEMELLAVAVRHCVAQEEKGEEKGNEGLRRWTGRFLSRLQVCLSLYVERGRKGMVTHTMPHMPAFAHPPIHPSSSTTTTGYTPHHVCMH